MQLPIVAPAPIVSAHAQAFRHLFNDVRQFEHFQNYLTGLIVLENKSLANISRCLLESADKTNLSRFLSESPWQPQAVNKFRIQYVLAQTVTIRPEAKQGYLIFDDTLCEHVGNLFEYVERHYDHCDGTYPLAHNLVTSHYLSGAVRIPIDFALYRRYKEVTQWEWFVHQHFPTPVIPSTARERQSLHKQLDQELLKDPKFAELHAQFSTKIEIAQALLTQAIEQGVPFTTVLMDSWYLSAQLVAALAEANKDWVSLLKRNRKLETHSFQLKDATGQPLVLPHPHIKVETLVPLIPASAYRQVKLTGQSYWCFSFCVRLEGLGKVRLVVSFDHRDLTGTYAVLITNCTHWSAKQILDHYLHRWPIETFYRDSKQLLGLDEYRTRTYAANEAHWCLVFVAYSLLHLGCLPPPSRAGKGKPSTIPNKTIGELCRQQAQAVIEELILFAHSLLQQGCSASQLWRKLFDKQTKEVLV
ncbi:MAG: transposase [Leptolyngbyaceae cyanobacterium bins.349]|nr:transposase [Leptolyngbyaceae cyanobacterium bins.349]